jgi:hypothetical protein
VSHGVGSVSLAISRGGCAHVLQGAGVEQGGKGRGIFGRISRRG